MSTKTPELDVLPNRYDGWDVKHADTADAITNHPDKAGAIEAARKIAEHEEGDVEVVVMEDAEGEISDEGRGMKLYFVALIGLLLIVTLIIIVVSAIGGGTEFGADDANLGEGMILSPLL